MWSTYQHILLRIALAENARETYTPQGIDFAHSRFCPLQVHFTVDFYSNQKAELEDDDVHYYHSSFFWSLLSSFTVLSRAFAH